MPGGGGRGGAECGPQKEAKYQDSSHNYPDPAFILLDKISIYRKQNQQAVRLLFCLSSSTETTAKNNNNPVTCERVQVCVYVCGHAREHGRVCVIYTGKGAGCLLAQLRK